MKNAHSSADSFTPQELELRVRQGLQKRKKCALCMQTFYVNELPGAITHKSVLELRQKWGMDIRRGDHMPQPSQLYKREEICIFCMQFFDTSGSMQTQQKLLASTRGGISPSLTMRWCSCEPKWHYSECNHTSQGATKWKMLELASCTNDKLYRHPIDG